MRILNCIPLYPLRYRTHHRSLLRKRFKSSRLCSYRCNSTRDLLRTRSCCKHGKNDLDEDIWSTDRRKAQRSSLHQRFETSERNVFLFIFVLELIIPFLQDIGWHDLQGASTKQVKSLNPNEPLPERSTEKSSTSAATSELIPVKKTGVRSTGDIISRLGSDASIVGESLTRELSEGLRALVTATVGIGAMLYISTKVTAVMLLIGTSFLIYTRRRSSLTRFSRTQSLQSRLLPFSTEDSSKSCLVKLKKLSEIWYQCRKSVSELSGLCRRSMPSNQPKRKRSRTRLTRFSLWRRLKPGLLVSHFFSFSFV